MSEYKNHDIWKYFQTFLYIMGIGRKLQSVVSSTSVIMYRSLLGLKTKLSEHENEIWEVSRVLTQNQYPSNQAGVIWAFMNLYTSPDIKPSIIHFRSIMSSITHFENIKKPIFCLFQWKSFHYQLNHSNVIYLVSICSISSSITLTDLFFRLSWFNLPYIESLEV